MNFLDVIKSRHSVRNFSPEPIPENFLFEMIEAARLAPSAQNKQCWRYIFVKNDALRKKLALNSGLISKVNYFIKDAPIIIVACAYPSQSVNLNNQAYYLVDTAISFQQMLLTAWNFGIGSCWLAAFNEIKVKEILSIPQEVKVVAMSPIGFPKGKKSLYTKAVALFANSKKRHSQDQIVSHNKWEF